MRACEFMKDKESWTHTYDEDRKHMHYYQKSRQEETVQLHRALNEVCHMPSQHGNSVDVKTTYNLNWNIFGDEKSRQTDSLLA